jgi:purine-binding chemotaxis protein CheW
MTDGKKRNSFGKDYIAFRVGPLNCCADAMSVIEIRGWTQATLVPRAAPYISGMINLRGSVLPVVDLSLRLGFAATVPTARHAIIVALVKQQVVGLLVDEVSDIIKLTEDMIKPTPEVGSELSRAFLNGVFANEGRLVGILALNALLPKPQEFMAA